VSRTLRRLVDPDYSRVVNEIHYLLLSAALTWIMIMTAAELHTATWTRSGAKLAFGNRVALPPPSAIAARADRAAKNMLENLVLFITVVVAARSAGTDASFGSAIFFFGRLGYFFTYVAGITYVRSLLWGVALFGVVWIGFGAVGIVH